MSEWCENKLVSRLAGFLLRNVTVRNLNNIIFKHPVALIYHSGSLITVYNATVYVNFNDTIAFDSLKLVKMF
jgi:hypothetical protein